MSFFILSLFFWLGVEAEVSLPLSEYRELTAHQQEKAKPSISQQKIDVHVEKERVQIDTQFVIFVPHPEVTTTLPVSGVIADLVLPEGELCFLSYHEKAYHFSASQAGSYKVRVKSYLDVEDFSFQLSAFEAPISSLNIEFPKDKKIEVSFAKKLFEESRLDGLLAVFSPERNKALEVSLLPSLEEEQQLMVDTVVATVLDLDDEDKKRRDIVFYDVFSGQLDEVEIKLPREVLVERAAFHDGQISFQVEDQVFRGILESVIKKPMTSFVLESTQDLAQVVKPVEPSVKTRSRFLILNTTRAQKISVEPSDVWYPISSDLLPGELQKAAASMNMTSIWRAKEEAPEARITLADYEALPREEVIVTSRTTESLWTLSGQITTKETISMSNNKGSLNIVLPTDTDLLVSKVNNKVVSPVYQGEDVLLPLPYGEEVEIELILFREQYVPKRRSSVEFVLAELAVPVLKHEWKLWMPDNKLYRYDSGSLDMVFEEEKKWASFTLEEMEDRSRSDRVVVKDDDLNSVPQSRSPWTVIMKVPSTQADRINVTQATGPASFTGIEIEFNPQGKMLTLSGVLPNKQVRARFDVKKGS